ncbi:alpha/beta hydrolase [Fructobacillus sp. M158]|uniref:alpha/beta fold hydrolase n=1 Tax=Fructobacillus parabroussonetiae TaxID=2713174 RepID=UPI00200B1DF3|nr:alpha/beta hydrolase [Fructobacillus parabroussonetiae]MCK8617189.1 alpha/beta hydrolase [Fructobacillus parabroussonetiae]
MAFFKSSDGVSLNYQDRLGKGQTAVLLSGFSGMQAEWQYQIDDLQEAGYRVVTMDWRSHGRSARTAKNLRISRLAADLAELFDLLDLNQILLIGHSMGASVIWAYLSLFGEEALDKVVLIDESPKLLNDSLWDGGIRGLNWTTFPVLSKSFFHQKLTVAAVSQQFKNALRVEKEAHPFNFDLVFPLLEDHLLADWRENLQACSRPLLFVAGEQSPLWKPDYIETVRPLFPAQSRVVVLSGTGHLPHLEKPADFNTILHSFID